MITTEQRISQVFNDIEIHINSLTHVTAWGKAIEQRDQLETNFYHKSRVASRKFNIESIYYIMFGDR